MFGDLASLATVLVAVWALRIWKTELRYRENRDVARRLLTQSREIREAFGAARCPLVEVNISGEDQRKSAIEAEWRSRYARVHSLVVGMETIWIEASVMWGSTAGNLMPALRESVLELKARVEAELHREPDRHARSLMLSIGEKDDLSESLEVALKAITDLAAARGDFPRS